MVLSNIRLHFDLCHVRFYFSFFWGVGYEISISTNKGKCMSILKLIGSSGSSQGEKHHHLANGLLVKSGSLAYSQLDEAHLYL